MHISFKNFLIYVYLDIQKQDLIYFERYSTSQMKIS
jgi:hypothetical protein